MNIQKQIQESLQSIIVKYILFACSAMTKQHEVDNSIDTAATDGKKIIYNEAFFQALSYKQRSTLICHELLHILLGHHLRMRGKDGELWNCACDYVINLILVQMNFEPLDNWLYDPKYKGWSAEDVYSDLKNQSKEKQDQQKKQSEESGGSFSEPKNSKGNEMSDAELEEAKGQAEQEAREAKSQLQRRMKGIEKSDTLTAQEKANQLKEIGQGTEAFSERLDDIKHSRIDWRAVVSRFLLEENETELNRERFNFYQMENSDFELIENARHSEEFGKVAFCMDVSGSLSHMTKEVCSEAFHALEQVQQGELITYYISTCIKLKQTITNADQLKTVTGGGTDFNCFFNRECIDGEFEAEGIIFVTDGHVNSSNWIEPPCNVLWVLTEANSWFEKTVPFGECVRMNS